MTPWLTPDAPAGCIVGSVPPAKALLFGPHPPLQLVTEALDMLSDGLLPVSLPLLGAVLSRCGPLLHGLWARLLNDWQSAAWRQQLF